MTQQRIREIDLRLAAWASWAVSGHAGPSAGISSIYRLGKSIQSFADTPIWSARIPYSTLEALATERAICQLPQYLRHELKLVYISLASRTMEERAAALHINRRTLHSHLCLADRLIWAILFPHSQPVGVDITPQNMVETPMLHKAAPQVLNPAPSELPHA